jgi:hypothetical protein
MRFSDELIGSEGEWCQVKGMRAIIRAVHNNRQNVTVQFENNVTAVVDYPYVCLEEDEV